MQSDAISSFGAAGNLLRRPSRRALRLALPVLLAVGFADTARARTFYLDAGGDDGASGRSAATPWKTLARVNAAALIPGDSVLFRRGQTWNGRLEIRRSGTPNARITFSSYGEGPMPVIDGGLLHQTVFVSDADYITIAELDLRGSLYATVLVQGSHYFLIERSAIGWDARGPGIRGTGAWSARQSSDYGVIRHCTVDTGLRGFVGSEGRDGIELIDGARHWRVHNNRVRAWPHSGIGLAQIFRPYETAYNHIYLNDIDGNDITYMRGFSIQGQEMLAHHNEIYRNYIHGTTQANHVNGNHNSVYYNIVDSVRNPLGRTDTYGFDLAIWFEWLTGSPYLVCHHNRIYHNLIRHTAAAGIMVVGTVNGAIPLVHDNEIVNNILVECAGGLTVLNLPMGPNTYRNNLIYNEGQSRVVSHRGLLVSVASFNGRSGVGGDSIGGNIQLDPLFADPGAGDYRLLGWSPAVDAGWHMGPGQDFLGQPVPYGPAPDIGPLEYHPPPCPIALTGDVNLDGSTTAADLVALVNYLFKSGGAPLPCAAAGDVNCSGDVTAADLILFVNYLFKAGIPPCDVCTLFRDTWSCP